MAIGLIIVGDEILSGRRQDAHLPKVVAMLNARGLQLAWAEIVGDDPARIVATLERTFASGDIVFSCGGIGATPDDHTRQCAAAALKRPLVLHPEAKTRIQERIREMAQQAGQPCDLDSAENLHRLKMGEFPQGAAIVPNPYNKVPGFSVGDHHFVPGFPVMAWPMIEWVLDTRYRHLHAAGAYAERSVLVFDGMESALTPLMERIEAAHPGVKVFSLPSVGGAGVRPHIDLGVKGAPAAVAPAFAALLAGLDAHGADHRAPDGEGA